jgi:hypothetical protein
VKYLCTGSGAGRWKRIRAEQIRLAVISGKDLFSHLGVTTLPAGAEGRVERLSGFSGSSVSPFLAPAFTSSSIHEMPGLSLQIVIITDTIQSAL